MAITRTIDGVTFALNHTLKKIDLNKISEDDFQKLIPCLGRLKESNLNIIKDSLVGHLSFSKVASKYGKSKSAVSAVIKLARKKHLINQLPEDWVCVTVLLPNDQANHVLKISTDSIVQQLNNLGK